MYFKTEFRLILRKDEEPEYDINNYLKEVKLMQKRVAKSGMEDIFEVVNNNIANIEAKKAEELNFAEKEINEKYLELSTTYNELLERVSEIVEIPDEPEQVADEESIEVSEEEIGNEEELV